MNINNVNLGDKKERLIQSALLTYNYNIHNYIIISANKNTYFVKSVIMIEYEYMVGDELIVNLLTTLSKARAEALFHTIVLSYKSDKNIITYDITYQ